MTDTPQQQQQPDILQINYNEPFALVAHVGPTDEFVSLFGPDGTVKQLAISALREFVDAAEKRQQEAAAVPAAATTTVVDQAPPTNG